MENKEHEIRRVIVKAWKDETFKNKLLKKPKEALAEMNYTIPENLEIRVVEDKENTFTFVLPPSPTRCEEISEAELEKVGGR